MRRHNGELTGGACYTRTRRPVRLVLCEEWSSLKEARRREHALKRLPRAAKEALIASQSLQAGTQTKGVENGGSNCDQASVSEKRDKKAVPRRIDLDELYRSVRKPVPKPTVVHRDRRRYSRKQKHRRPPEEEA